MKQANVTIWNAATGQVLENSVLAEILFLSQAGDRVWVHYKQEVPEIGEVLDKKVVGNIIVGICEHKKIDEQEENK